MEDTDKLGLVDKGFGKKTFNRLISFINRNRVLPIRPGWEQTPDGIVPPPAVLPGSGVAPEYWRLIVEDSELATVSIGKQGILKQTAAIDGTGDVTITNADSTFTAAIDKYLVIELTEGAGNTVDAELKLSSEWTSYPYMWDVVLDGANYVMDSATFPLYFFLAPDSNRTDLLTVNDTIAAKKMIPNIANWQMHEIYWENASGNAVSVIDLLPGWGTDA